MWLFPFHWPHLSWEAEPVQDTGTPWGGPAPPGQTQQLKHTAWRGSDALGRLNMRRLRATLSVSLSSLCFNPAFLRHHSQHAQPALDLNLTLKWPEPSHEIQAERCRCLQSAIMYNCGKQNWHVSKGSLYFLR